MATDYKNLKVFPKSLINGLTKHLGGLRFNKEPGNRTNDIFIDTAKNLGLEIDYNDTHLPGEKFMFTMPRKITKEQTTYGKAWLKSYFFKLDGSPRSGKRTQYVDESTLEIAKRVTRFEFVGVMGCGNYTWEIQHFLPIYRAYDSKSNYFDYSPVHWGEPVIYNESTTVNETKLTKLVA